MSTVIDIRNAIAARIKGELAYLRTCEGYHGRFDEEELKAHYRAAPAVLVVCDGVDEASNDGGQPVATWRWVAFVFAANPKAGSRGEAAAIIAEQVIKLVTSERWGKEVAKAEKVRADCLYSDKFDAAGVGVWQVFWSQQADIALEEPANIADFLKFNSTFDLAPKDGQVDAEGNLTLEGPSP